jgi:hypothetical protein
MLKVPLSWCIEGMATDTFAPPGKRLVFTFGSQAAAEHFKSWLCGSGEQHYWNWMEHREGEEDGAITALSFNYHTGTETITTKCGRMDR